MKIKALLDSATDTQQYADDCDVSSGVGKPVTITQEQTGEKIKVGIVTRLWVEDGSLHAEMEIDDSFRELFT